MDIIIGAGISGLSYAAYSDSDYIILEKSDSIGGYCKTIHQDGFTWDYSGHFFHFKNNEIKKFLLERMDSNKIFDIQKNTQIYYKDNYIDFPFQKNIHQLEKDEFLDCLYDLFNTPQCNNESFKSMVYSQLGKSISDKFLIPYNEKLYACDLDLLDKEAMGRFFPKADRLDIINNFRNPDNKSYNSHFTYPEGGAIEYVNSLASRVNSDKIYLNEEVIEIDKGNKSVVTNKRKLHYDNLISSIPFPKLLKKLNYYPKDSPFTWNKVLVFNIGFDSKGKDKKNHWVYFPEKEIRFYRIGYYDNIFNTDRMSLYVEIGFSKDDKIDIEKELDNVISDLEKTGIKRTDQNIISHVGIVMDPAYVHINKKSQLLFEKYDEKIRNESIYSIGRYGGWKYCSIEDNIIEAKSLVEKINE